jgi:hypothetical protein
MLTRYWCFEVKVKTDSRFTVRLGTWRTREKETIGRVVILPSADVLVGLICTVPIPTAITTFPFAILTGMEHGV